MTAKRNIDYRNVYNSSPDMCLSLIPETGEIIECNQTLLDVLGYTKEEVLNASLFDLYHEGELEKVQNNLLSIKENRHPDNKEFIIVKKNGEPIEVTLNLSFVRDKNNNVIYTNAVWRDITELKDTQRNLKIEKDKLERKNNDFISATNYANRIQTGMLPSDKEISVNLPNSFILYRPKDIVSGDFYWTHQIGEEVLFSVFDCTGHGIPGAFMSILGGSLMNQIVSEQNCFYPEAVLTKMRSSIIRYLKQDSDGRTTADGMDGILCVLNKKTRTLRYSSANQSLILIRENSSKLKNIDDEQIELKPTLTSDTHDLYVLKGDRQPIGYFNGLGKIFCEKNIQLQEGDMIYLSSDGFQDQIGGEKGKKYLSKRYKKFLFDISQLPLNEQEQRMNEELNDWMGEKCSQTDDICVWSVRI